MPAAKGAGAWTRRSRRESDRVPPDRLPSQRTSSPLEGHESIVSDPKAEAHRQATLKIFSRRSAARVRIDQNKLAEVSHWYKNERRALDRAARGFLTLKTAKTSAKRPLIAAVPDETARRKTVEPFENSGEMEGISKLEFGGDFFH